MVCETLHQMKNFREGEATKCKTGSFWNREGEISVSGGGWVGGYQIVDLLGEKNESGGGGFVKCGFLGTPTC